MPSIHIHLVRHGQSEWNAIGRLQGHTAHPALTALGREQAAAAAEHLAAVVQGDAALWCSDLERARQTALVIGARLGLEPREDIALREQSYGSLEGTSASAPRPVPADGTHPSEVRWGDGESSADVHARVAGFLRRVTVESPEHLVLVTHGDTIRAALAVLAGRTHRAIEDAVPGNGEVHTVTLPRP